MSWKLFPTVQLWGFFDEASCLSSHCKLLPIQVCADLFPEFVSLHGFLNLVQTSFSNVSRDRGFLALNEVYQSFDPNQLGKFKLDDYISMNLFGAFDTSRIGHITLDFNQFVYCAANLREEFPVNGNVPAQHVICCFYLSKYNPK